MNIFPVFVPSKGRPECPTAALLRRAGVAHSIVVEPQDLHAYLSVVSADRQESPPLKATSEMVELPKNDGGLAFVRNHVKGLGGDGWFWMLDDDITGFYKAQSGKNVRISADRALLEAQEVFSPHEQIGQAALEYQQFAWRARDSMSVFGYCDVAVCIHAGRTKALRYRDELVLKEDRDFTLQVLSAGLITARAAQISFSAPKNGSNAGGLKPLYDTNGRERLAVDRLAAAWGPEIVTSQVKPDGRYDAKINWGFFRKRAKARVGA